MPCQCDCVAECNADLARVPGMSCVQTLHVSPLDICIWLTSLSYSGHARMSPRCRSPVRYILDHPIRRCCGVLHLRRPCQPIRHGSYREFSAHAEDFQVESRSIQQRRQHGHGPFLPRSGSWIRAVTDGRARGTSLSTPWHHSGARTGGRRFQQRRG